MSNTSRTPSPSLGWPETARGDYTLVPAYTEVGLEPLDKIDVHRRGIRHKAVSVFVMDGDRLLLQQRAASKYHTPGLWTNTCCTHPLWDEAPRDCALRRLEEELGITGVDPVHRHALEYRADVGGGLIEHEEVDVFVANWPEGAEVVPNPDEVQAVQWLTLEDVMGRIANDPARFTPWLRIYLETHRAEIFG